MVRHIDDPKILGILIDNKLIHPEETSYLTLTWEEEKHGLLKVLIGKEIIDNEQTVEVLIKNRFFPSLSQEEGVFISNYEKLEDYLEKGYFIYNNTIQTEIIAINNL